MASKFDQFLNASWNTIFSAQEAPRAQNPADVESARRNAQPPGEGLGEKSRRFDVKNMALKGSKDLNEINLFSLLLYS